jgi:hypothetical protein
MGAIIPLYVGPTSSLWNTIMSAKDAHPNVPIAVVIDVAQGPGTAAQTAIATLLTNLRAKNIITLGYVYTDYALRSLGAVEADVDNWFNFYNAGTPISNRKLNGIFMGAMSNNSTKESYYHDLQIYCKTTKGFNTTCGEAANKVPTSFLGSNCADTVVVYEGVGLPAPSGYQIYENSNRNNIAFLPFAIASINTEWLNQASSLSVWIYHTNDQGMAVWDTLPPYFNDLIARLDTMGDGSSVGASFDTFGIKKIYHTKAAGQEWYISMNDPNSDERFQNQPALTRNNDGSWSLEGSGTDKQVRLEAWSPALSDQTQRQNARWLNVEITGYAKAEQEFGQGGPYLFQWYGRGGHHSDTRHCEGSTLKLALWRRREVGSDPGLSAAARKEVCHAAYTGTRGTVNNAIPHTSTDFYNRWVGMKAIIYNYVSGGNTYTHQEMYLDRDVQDGNGNLNAQNDWQLIMTYNDTGGWFANESTFNSDCDGCGYARDQIIIVPGGDTRSSSSNYNRNLVAWRTDDFRWRFKFLTAREIDPSKPAGGEPAPPPSTDPASAFDSFGVRKVYNTKSGGAEWYLAATPSNDARFVATHAMTKNSDNISWRVQPASPYLVTFQIKQPNGYDPSRTEAAAQNHAQCASNGYMQDAQDWRNVEMQGYVKVRATAPSTNSELIWFCRGGEHKDPQPYCAGSSMKAFLMTTGETRFAKEQYHIYYNYTAIQNQVNQNIVGKWIGFKYVIYNRKVGTTSSVRQEIYIDIDNNNTWTKIDEKVDTGGWGAGGLQCKGNTEDFLISWGGPIATFRFDNAADFDVKWLSIREINGDAVAIQPPPSQPPGSCGST